MLANMNATKFDLILIAEQGDFILKFFNLENLKIKTYCIRSKKSQSLYYNIKK